MFISIKDFKTAVAQRINMLERQGYDTKEYADKLTSLPDSYDALIEFASSMNKNIKIRPDFLYEEPDDLPGIQASRPEEHTEAIKNYISETEIKDKTYGGVAGRMIGCVLGKPLEIGWDLPKIKEYLEGADAWPLCDFVPPHSSAKTGTLRRDCIDSMKGFVRYVQEDDDINYMILGLKILEDYGCNFTTQDMAANWINNIPYMWTWGPEHTIYCQLANYYINHGSQKLPVGEDWDNFADFINSGEELIGAMIRGDAFGLVNPGQTGTAAKMAWRDGRLTHRKTGLYAEMWVAAAIAAAYYERDPAKVIKAGIDQIPAKSRYAECLREALRLSLEEPDWYKAWEKINEKWGNLGHAGTMNESAAIINALIHSADNKNNIDFEKVICLTVMQGWDTDCAGATAGCIAGVLCGYNNLPQKWLSKLNDTFYSCVAAERETSIEKFSERMYQMSRIVRECGK